MPSIEERVEATQATRRSAFAEIRGDQNLSEDGRSRLLAKADTETRAEIRGLKAEYLEREEAELRHRVREAFGPPSPGKQAEYRAALAQADALASPAKALEHLERAVITADAIYGQAVATIAAGRGWNGVLDRYSKEFPSGGAPLKELTDFVAAASSPANKLRESMAFSVSTPSELSRSRPIPDEVQAQSSYDARHASVPFTNNSIPANQRP